MAPRRCHPDGRTLQRLVHRLALCVVLQAVCLLCRLGDLSVTDAGILQWSMPCGNVAALQQFRDNAIVAAKARHHIPQCIMCA